MTHSTDFKTLLMKAQENRARGTPGLTPTFHKIPIFSKNIAVNELFERKKRVV